MTTRRSSTGSTSRKRTWADTLILAGIEVMFAVMLYGIVCLTLNVAPW